MRFFVELEGQHPLLLSVEAEDATQAVGVVERKAISKGAMPADYETATVVTEVGHVRTFARAFRSFDWQDITDF